ncbi:hypothetical protein YC2023_062697 [Brassica napus]
MALVVLKAPADKFSRLAKMTMDFLLWSIDNPPADDRQGNIPPQVYSVQLLSWQDLSTVGKCKSLHPRPEDRTLFK